MNTDTITVRPRHAIELVLRYLRLRKDLPKSTDSLIVVNSADEYVGMLPLAKLLTSDPSVIVREIMDSDIPAIHVSETDAAVARIFSERDLISAPERKLNLVLRIFLPRQHPFPIREWRVYRCP